MKNVVFYQTNGVAVFNRNEIKTSFYVEEHIGQKLYDSRFFYDGDSMMYDLDELCADLYNVFQGIIFPNSNEYYDNIGALPHGIMNAGLDSDCALSKEQLQMYFDEPLRERLFEGREMHEIKSELFAVYNDLDLKKYKFAYLADCQSYVNSVQSLIQICRSNFVNFYKYFCQLEGTANFSDNYYCISTDGQIVISMASNIFVLLYSIFDILTKIIIEIEKIKKAESYYPKFASSKKLYGNGKEICSIDKEGTIFEKSRNISIIENVRNELVHNAAWEMNPKIFFNMKGDMIIDKAIYFPDFSEDGHFITYKNRKRFFSQRVKLNEILPDIYLEVLERIKVTLERITKKKI